MLLLYHCHSSHQVKAIPRRVFQAARRREKAEKVEKVEKAVRVRDSVLDSRCVQFDRKRTASIQMGSSVGSTHSTEECDSS